MDSSVAAVVAVDGRRYAIMPDSSGNGFIIILVREKR